MGLLFNDSEKIRKEVNDEFGANTSYLLAIKHNKPIKKGLKLLLSNLYNTYDSNRTFILIIDSKGIYEKEISVSSKTNFYLYPKNEITNFNIEEKSNKSYINFDHLGKNISYEISYVGRLFKGNKQSLEAIMKDEPYKYYGKED